jgi:hypothetical protein
MKGDRWKDSFNLNSEVLIDKIKMMLIDVDSRAIADRAYDAAIPMSMIKLMVCRWSRSR